MNRASQSSLLAALCGLAVAAPAAHAATLDVTSGVPAFTPVDLGPSGPSLGDVNVFESAITGGGQLLGVQTTMGAASRALTVQGALTFDLPDGQLAVAGVSQIDPTPTGLLPGRPYVRAVVGGSGSYAGMRGTVTSTRRADGTYSQAFQLNPPAGATRTVSVSATSGPGRQIDVAAPGNSPGDMSIVDDAVLHDPAGAVVGSARGYQQVVSTTDGRVVQAQLVYRLPDGNLLVGGVSRQVVDGTGLVIGTTFVRPVLGGTGAYAGAGGTMTTTLSADGTYGQRFDLSGLGARTTRTVRLVATGPGGAQGIDQLPAGASAGDQLAFTNTLRDTRGRHAGIARGVHTLIAAENGMELATSQVTYQVRGRGTLVVGGLSLLPAAGANGTTRGKQPVRMVIGGTGAFAGAHGTLRAARGKGNSYRLTFSLSR